MYKIGDKVVDKTGKIFEVDTIEEKNFGSKSEQYFVLRPCFKYNFNPGYHLFVPVSKEELLRPVLSKEEALSLIDSINTLDTYSDVSPKDRKIYFQKILTNGNRIEILKIIKTLYEYREERRKMNKPLSEFDRRLLKDLTDLMHNEFSLALSIPVADVERFINERIDIA